MSSACQNEEVRDINKMQINKKHLLLLIVCIITLIIDAVVVDPIPFIDEVALGGLTIKELMQTFVLSTAQQAADVGLSAAHDRFGEDSIGYAVADKAHGIAQQKIQTANEEIHNKSNPDSDVKKLDAF